MAPLISKPLAITTTLVSIVTLFFFLEQRTQWRLFTYFPPLLFIYAVPMVLSSTGVLASQSPVYDWMRGTMLPFLLTLMLLKVDVLWAIKVMGRGVLVMLSGTLGVILGAPLAYLLVKSHLDPGAWKAFGALSGSWIGGTGNMASMELALKRRPGVPCSRIAFTSAPWARSASTSSTWLRRTAACSAA